MDKLIIRTDITDWRDEALQNETIITSESELDSLIEDGLSISQIARAAIVSREIKQAPSDILPENKLLLSAGGEVAITRRAVSKKREMKVGEKIYHVRDLVGRSQGEVSEKSYRTTASSEGNSRVEDYILRVIPGYIMGRFLIIHQNGGNVKAMGDALKAKIDEIVSELTQ